jgi:hypothetical protein
MHQTCALKAHHQLRGAQRLMGENVNVYAPTDRH